MMPKRKDKDLRPRQFNDCGEESSRVGWMLKMRHATCRGILLTLDTPTERRERERQTDRDRGRGRDREIK